jgi:hypothetical protein
MKIDWSYPMREEVTANPAPARAPDVAPGNAAGSNGAADAPPWAAFSPARGRFVRGVVVGSVALTLLAAASIYWRWANVYEPTSYITVLGNEDLNGTLVVVSSPNYPESMATLNRDNNYTAAIFLHPGSYTVTATLNGRPLAHAGFVVGGRKAASLNLSARRPTGAGTTQAAS